MSNGFCQILIHDTGLSSFGFCSAFLGHRNGYPFPSPTFRVKHLTAENLFDTCPESENGEITVQTLKQGARGSRAVPHLGMLLNCE